MENPEAFDRFQDNIEEEMLEHLKTAVLKIRMFTAFEDLVSCNRGKFFKIWKRMEAETDTEYEDLLHFVKFVENPSNQWRKY